jgi:hypothetical protein
MRALVVSVAATVPETSDTLRRELEMWEVAWMAPQEATFEVDVKVKADELTKNKAEWLKKAKKKKWNDEMEKELIEEYRRRFGEKVQ